MTCCNGFGTIGRREGDLHLPGLMQRLCNTSTPATHDDPLARELVQHTACTHSASSYPTAARSHVTLAPRRRNACASSRPVAPAPITTRCSGTVEVEIRLIGEKRRVLEAGIRWNGRTKPVAMTKRLALISVASPSRTCCPVGEDCRASNHANAKPRDAHRWRPARRQPRGCARALWRNRPSPAKRDAKTGAAPIRRCAGSPRSAPSRADRGQGDRRQTGPVRSARPAH